MTFQPTFQEECVLADLEHRTGFNRSQLIRMGINALPLLASGDPRRTLQQFENALTAAAFQAQIREVDQEHEAIVLTEIASDLDKHGNHPDSKSCRILWRKD